MKYYFLILLLIPTTAYSFNSIILADPAFLEFILIYLPIIGGILISIWEGVIFRTLFPTEYNLKIFFKITLLNNIVSLLFYVILTAIILTFTKDALFDAQYPIVIWVGLCYFMLAFIYFASDKKLKLLTQIPILHSKYLKLKIYLVNIISYSAIYFYLFQRLL